MPFTVSPKDAPDKVPGVLHGEKPKTSRDRAIEALMGGKSAEAPKPAPQVDPAAAAASNAPAASGQLSTEAFTAIQSKMKAESDTQSPTNEKAPSTPTKTDSEATKTEEGTEQALSPRFAQLARQEKAIRARSAQLKAEQAALEEAQKALKAREAEIQDKYVPKDRLSKETLAVLNELGVDYDTLTQQVLGEEADPRDVAISELKAELAALKGEVETTRKSYQDDKTKAYEDAKVQIKSSVTKLVNSDPNFETIKATDSIQDVVDLIESTFHEGLDEDRPKGTVLSVEEASQIVEDYLVEEAEKLARLSKIQKRLAPKVETKTDSQPKQDSSQQPQRQPTLTNGMTGAPKREYTQRQRAVFAAQYGPNWQEKVGEKAS